jgi:predicted nucleic acid-binding protein
MGNRGTSHWQFAFKVARGFNGRIFAAGSLPGFAVPGLYCDRVTPTGIPSAYLDAAFVIALAKDDHPAESSALDALLEFREQGKIHFCSSEVTRQEFDKYRGKDKAAGRILRLLDKVAFMEDYTVQGFRNWQDQRISYRLVSDDRISSELRRMKIDRFDAHHLMLAIRARCTYFLTFDGGILKVAPAIEARFNIKALKPSTLVALNVL